MLAALEYEEDIVDCRLLMSYRQLFAQTEARAMGARTKQSKRLDYIPWGRGTPLYGLYRYVRPQRVCFFSRLGHK